MLHRNSIGACFAAMAILFTTTFNNNVLAAPIFADGDFITFRQADWGDVPNGTNAATLLTNNFATVYPLGVLRVGLATGFSILLTSGPAVLTYLPTAGAPTALTGSAVDPVTTSSGQFGGELTALHLNVDFTDAGLIGGTLGIPFGDLTLANFPTLPGLEGISLRDFISTADRAIGGDATGFSPGDLRTIAAELNAAYLQGVPSQYAQDHLRVSEVAVPEPATAGLVLLGLLALGLVRRRSRV